MGFSISYNDCIFWTGLENFFESNNKVDLVKKNSKVGLNLQLVNREKN